MGAWKHVKVLRDGVDVNVKILITSPPTSLPRWVAAEPQRISHLLSHRLIPAGRRTFAQPSVQCILNSSAHVVLFSTC